MSVRIDINAGFVDGSFAPLFCKEVACCNTAVSDNDNYIIVVPPFAEEMNRSRRLLSVLSKSIANENKRLVLPDLYGTGDSSGCFSDAGWDIWINDIIAVTEHVARMPHSTISFLALRAGCLLLDEVVKKLTITIDRLCLVAPVYKGRQVIHSMLRSRVAADRFAGRIAVSSDQLWLQLEQGYCVESSGYLIPPDIALPMRDRVLDMAEITSSVSRGILIELHDRPIQLEHQISSNRESVPIKKFPDYDSNGTMIDNSLDVSSILPSQWNRKSIRCKPFWQLHEYEPSSQEIENLIAGIG